MSIALHLLKNNLKKLKITLSAFNFLHYLATMEILMVDCDIPMTFLFDLFQKGKIYYSPIIKRAKNWYTNLRSTWTL